jgi:hypothetical protein
LRLLVPPCGGKSHQATGIGISPIEKIALLDDMVIIKVP